MNTIELATILKDLALAGAAVTTAVVAYKGVEKWKQELQGRANFEVARSFIRSTYKLRDELTYGRSPFVSASEFPEGYSTIGANPTAQEHGDAWGQVFSNRWKPVGTAVQEFDAETLEAEALWGSVVKEKSKVLRQCVRSFQVDIDCYIRNEYGGREEFQDRNYAERVRAGVFETHPTEENDLSSRVKAAVDDLELVIRPHLKRS